MHLEVYTVATFIMILQLYSNKITCTFNKETLGYKTGNILKFLFKK